MLILLAVGLVMVDILGGWLLRSIHPHSTANPIAKVAMKGTRTLILGSSTAKYAFDPAVLWPDTYNASSNGLGLFHVAALMRNLPAGTNVQRVIFGLDPADLASGYRNPGIKYLKRLSAFAVTDAILRKQIALSDPYLDLKFYSGLYPYRRNFWSLIKEWWWPDLSGNGYSPLAGTETDVKPWAPTGDAPDEVAPEALAALDQIVAAANRHKIQLVLVVTPIVGGQRRETDPRYAKIMEAIRARTSTARVCDLTVVRAPGIDGLVMNGALFHDGPHFNGKGARRYSAIVKALADRHCGPLISVSQAKKRRR